MDNPVDDLDTITAYGEPSESARALADLIWYGYANETGGQVGTKDLM